VLAPISAPFQPNGGLKMLTGNLGKAVIKISAVKPERHVIEAPAVIFHSQGELQEAFRKGELEKDFVAVIRFQGPKANGMPELHKLTPSLGVLQDRGYKVALVTDGRMSGASGKVPAAIHVTPEALDGGPIAKVRDGDMVRVDATKGTLEVLVPAAEFEAGSGDSADLSGNSHGTGRELFETFRRVAGHRRSGRERVRLSGQWSKDCASSITSARRRAAVSMHGTFIALSNSRETCRSRMFRSAISPSSTRTGGSRPTIRFPRRRR
jgi:phosphogluconate dehydratase